MQTIDFPHAQVPRLIQNTRQTKIVAGSGSFRVVGSVYAAFHFVMKQLMNTQPVRTLGAWAFDPPFRRQRTPGIHHNPFHS
jgi:hypothetical protein